jgi:hypothetical protein
MEAAGFGAGLSRWLELDFRRWREKLVKERRGIGGGK